MKKTILLIKTFRAAIYLFLLLFSLPSCTNENFTFGTTNEFTHQSAANGAINNTAVELPDNYNSLETYATIRVLDGKEIFGCGKCCYAVI